MKYKSELNQLIIVANNRLQNHCKTSIRIRLGEFVIIQYNLQNPEYTYTISPHLSWSNLTIWLNGFIEGLDF